MAQEMDSIERLVQRCLENAKKAAQEAKERGPSSEPKTNTCEICGGTGWKYVTHNTVTECPCVQVQRQKEWLAASGLAGVLDRMTFDTFQAATPWQRKAKERAQAFAQAVEGGAKPWLFFGGAVGSGKTHLCTAACGYLMAKGKRVRYMLWPEESRRLRACVTDREEFDRMTTPLFKADVLYIDDLFKCQRGGEGGKPSPAEVRVAFELLDARYRANKPTILSTEWLMDELMDVDEGTFSRVYQMCQDFRVQISRDPGRNYRLTGPKGGGGTP